MPLLDSIARLLAAIAWPTAIVVVAFLFKEPLVDLLKHVRRLGYREWHLDFGEQVSELEAKADEANLPTVAPVAEADALERVVVMFPRMAVVEAWRRLELDIREAAKQRGLPDDANVGKLIDQLVHTNVLSEKTKWVLWQMRGLRNQAVHEEDMDLDAKDASEYVELAERVRLALEQPS